jgi:hypothetical protein
MSNVAINIAAEYTGKPAFKEAQRSVQTLERTVKRFAGGLGIGLGLSAVTAFGKAAVKAFAADEAAAVRLSGAVNNLGIAFANPAIAKYISELEATSAVADDVLRPAFQSLLTTTGSLTQSQKLLADAITISRAKGIDLATVSQDLANGYVGITRGLKKYNTGLTQSELKSKSFSEVLGILLRQSTGAANAYLETTAYKLDVFSVAADNAKEKIGLGLVDALARVGGGTEASDAAKAMELFGTAVYNTELRIGDVIGAIPRMLKILKNLPSDIFQGFAGKQGGISSTAPKKPKDDTPSKTKQAKILAKLESDALKRAKAIAAEQKKITEEARKQAALKKLGKVFDLEQANLIAALQGKLTDDERTRAEAQLALLNGNEKVAESLTKKILMTQDATGNLYRLWQTLPDARNPFEYLDAYLDKLARKAAAILSLEPSAVGGYVGTTPLSNAQIAANLAVGATIADLEKTASPWLFGGQSASSTGPVLPSTNVAPMPSTGYGTNFRRAEEASNLSGPIQVVVQLDGKAIASSMQNQSLSGTPTGVNRSGGMFGS